MERALIWQVSVSQASRKQLQSSRKILHNFQLSKSRTPCFCPDGPETRPNAHLCREDSTQLSMHSSGRQGNTIRTLVSVREESEILCRHGLGRQFAAVRTLGQHRPDVALIRKRMKCVMERLLQFTLWTPPRELWMSVEIGFLKPINIVL
jgi:hypothetical protein